MFVTCAFAVFSLAMFSAIWDLPKDGAKGIFNINSSSLKFGLEQVTAPTLKILPACFIVGALGGLLGGWFVIINNWMAFFRKFYITTKWWRPLEAGAFSILTTTCFFWAPYVFSRCVLNDTVESDETKELLVTYTCPKGSYNPLATLFFNTEGAAIGSIIAGQEEKGLEFSAF